MKSITLAFVGILACAASAMAEETVLKAQDIKDALTKKTVIYDAGAKQYFSHTGATPYLDKNGTPSMGRWAIRGDKYCSVWGGSGWSCYDMTGNGADRITFIGEFGDKYPGRIEDGKTF